MKSKKDGELVEAEADISICTRETRAWVRANTNVGKGMAIASRPAQNWRGRREEKKRKKRKKLKRSRRSRREDSGEEAKEKE